MNRQLHYTSTDLSWLLRGHLWTVAPLLPTSMQIWWTYLCNIFTATQAASSNLWLMQWMTEDFDSPFHADIGALLLLCMGPSWQLRHQLQSQQSESATFLCKTPCISKPSSRISQIPASLHDCNSTSEKVCRSYLHRVFWCKRSGMLLMICSNIFSIWRSLWWTICWSKSFSFSFHWVKSWKGKTRLGM